MYTIVIKKYPGTQGISLNSGSRVLKVHYFLRADISNPSLHISFKVPAKQTSRDSS